MDTTMKDIFEAFDNSTVSAQSEDQVSEERISDLENAVTATSLSIVIACTIFGNILVIVAVFTCRQLRNVQNMFIVSLAMADITVAVLVMPLNVAYGITGQWRWGDGVCKMWLTCDVMCCTASILNLCAIALDRYWAICDPINYAQKRTLKRILCMIAFVWGASLLISAPPLMGWNDWPDVFTDDTICALTEEWGYVVFSTSCSFYIPLVIMTVVYAKIYVAARNRIRGKANAAAHLGVANESTDNASSTITLKSLQSNISNNEVKKDTTQSSDPCNAAYDNNIELEEDAPPLPSDTAVEEGRPNGTAPTSRNPEENSAAPPMPGVSLNLTSSMRNFVREKQKISFKKERRAAKVLGIVMGVFVLCWLPFFLMYVITTICTDCYISSKMLSFLTWLGYVNSTMNPVIYTMFNMDFRRAIAKILCKRRFC